MKRALVGAAAAALPLAGCSSASSATSATSAPTVPAGSPTAAAPSATPSGPALGPVSAAQQVLNDAVAKVGCSKFYLGSPPAPAVDLWGPCLLDEKSVTFYVVSTDSNEKNFLALLTNLGYSPKQIIKAPSLLAAVEDPTQVEQVRSALNGSLTG